jgi:hypothetical protein
LLSGPIVRISPHEVHINDPDFYDELYTGGGNRRDKWVARCNWFGLTTASFATAPHDLWRARRMPLDAFFSKRSVTRLTPVILSRVERLCSRISEWREKQPERPIYLRYAYAALALDTITAYSFGKSDGALDKPDFWPQWLHAVDGLGESKYLVTYFPFIVTLMKMVPVSLLEALGSSMVPVVWHRKVGDYAAGNVLQNLLTKSRFSKSGSSPS